MQGQPPQWRADPPEHHRVHRRIVPKSAIIIASQVNNGIYRDAGLTSPLDKTDVFSCSFLRRFLSLSLTCLSSAKVKREGVVRARGGGDADCCVFCFVVCPNTFVVDHGIGPDRLQLLSPVGLISCSQPFSSEWKNRHRIKQRPVSVKWLCALRNLLKPLSSILFFGDR